MFVGIKPYFCKTCKEYSAVTFNNSLQKKDMYSFTCEKGHLLEIFISKDLIKVLKKFPIADDQF